MTRRRSLRFATAVPVAIAAVVLAGCTPQGPASVPQPTLVPSEPSSTPTPSETAPVPAPTTDPPEAPSAPFSTDVIIDAVIAKDATAVVAQLGDPIREIDTLAGVDANRSAGEIEVDLGNILTTGENFKPGQDADYETLRNSAYPEFGDPGAVVLFGSQGTLLSFLPNGFLRMVP